MMKMSVRSVGAKSQWCVKRATCQKTFAKWCRSPRSGTRASLYRPYENPNDVHKGWPNLLSSANFPTICGLHKGYLECAYFTHLSIVPCRLSECQWVIECPRIIWYTICYRKQGSGGCSKVCSFKWTFPHRQIGCDFQIARPARRCRTEPSGCVLQLLWRITPRK